MAVKGPIKVVREEWFWKSAEKGGMLNPKDYLFNPTIPAHRAVDTDSHDPADSSRAASRPSSQLSRRLTALLPTRSQQHPDAIPASASELVQETNMSSNITASIVAQFEGLLCQPSRPGDPLPLDGMAFAFSPCFTSAERGVLRRAVRKLGGTTREEYGLDATHYVVLGSKTGRIRDQELEELRALDRPSSAAVIRYAWLFEALCTPETVPGIENFTVDLPQDTFVTPNALSATTRPQLSQRSQPPSSSEPLKLKRPPSSSTAADTLREIQESFAAAENAMKMIQQTSSGVESTSGSVAGARRRTLAMTERRSDLPRDASFVTPVERVFSASEVKVQEVERTHTGFSGTEDALVRNLPNDPVPALGGSARAVAVALSNVFKDMRFSSTHFEGTLVDSIKHMVRSNGGEWRDMPPVTGKWYNVVGILGASSLLGIAGEIPVTDLWLVRCCAARRVLDLSGSPVWTPRDSSNIDGFRKLRVGVTNFEDIDRQEVTQVATALGAPFTENFTRRHTHLICPTISEEYGRDMTPKRIKSREWGIPIVSRAWLFASFQAGQPLPVDDYLVPDVLPEDQETGDQGKENSGDGYLTGGVLDTRGVKRALDSVVRKNHTEEVRQGTQGKGNVLDVFSRNLARAGGRFAVLPSAALDFGLSLAANRPHTNNSELEGDEKETSDPPPSFATADPGDAATISKAQSGLLEGVKLFLGSKSIDRSRESLQTTAEVLGAELVGSVSECTHAVFARVRGVESTTEFKSAVRAGISRVSANWLLANPDSGVPDVRSANTASATSTVTMTPISTQHNQKELDTSDTTVSLLSDQRPGPPTVHLSPRSVLAAKVDTLLTSLPRTVGPRKRRRVAGPTEIERTVGDQPTVMFETPDLPRRPTADTDMDTDGFPEGSPPPRNVQADLAIAEVTWHDPQIKDAKRRLLEMVGGGGKRPKNDGERADIAAHDQRAKAVAPGDLLLRDRDSSPTEEGKVIGDSGVDALTRTEATVEGSVANKELENGQTVASSKGSKHRTDRSKIAEAAKTPNPSVTATTAASTTKLLDDRRRQCKIVFTSASLSERQRYKSILERCGAVVYDGPGVAGSWQFDLTHLVVAKAGGVTDKLLAAVSSGSWVVRTSYVEACAKEGTLVDEEEHEWTPELAGGKGTVLASARRWRLHLGNYLSRGPRRGAFSEFKAYIVVSGATTESVVRVLKAGGLTDFEVGKKPYAVDASFTHVLIDVNLIKRDDPDGDWRSLVSGGLVACYELQHFLTKYLSGENTDRLRMIL
ncbi:DNA topoisomerase 2-binding protein 1 [Gonapodya sp. JEL0774]|nr:DNA topoisomerase 2-binding protein 1 [Gonapodya sp. JEL0774]